MTSHENGPEQYGFILESDDPIEESFISILEAEKRYRLDVHLRIAIDSPVEVFQSWLESYQPMDWSQFDQQGRYIFHPTDWDINSLPNKYVRIFRTWQISTENSFFNRYETTEHLIGLQELNDSLYDWMTIDITPIAKERLELQISFQGHRFFPYFQGLIRYMAVLWPSVKNGYCSFSVFKETTIVSEFLKWSPEKDTVDIPTGSSMPETRIDGETPISQMDDPHRPHFAYPKLKETEAIDRLAKAKVGLELKRNTKLKWAEIQRRIDWSYGDTSESRKKLYENARKKYESLAEQKDRYSSLYAKVEARAKKLGEYQEGKAGN